VAKSRRASTVEKVWGCGVLLLSSSSSGDEDEEGTWASEADFSTAGVLTVRVILRGWKAWFSIRYCWIEDLPAQMPDVLVNFGVFVWRSLEI
jgi:hypothetical protein